MSGFPAIFQLSNLNGTNGFRLDGESADDFSGGSVSSAGDINGDGFADLIVGADRADPKGSNSGASYVVFGKASGFSASLNLSSLDGTNGFRLDGAAVGNNSGTSVSSAGDINGDGFADLVVGAPGADPNGSVSGSSYVVFGKASGFAASLNLSSLDGTNGFRLDGVAAFDFSGGSVSSAGDVNGDGFADLIVGAYRAPTGADQGFSYVVFGKASGFTANLNLSSLDGTNGFRLDGVSNGDFSGRSVSSAGDINGDGFADLIVGADRADPNGSNSGASYVVFGKASGFAASLNLSSLNGTNGFRLDGVAGYDNSGRSVSSAGDVNGDGFDDLIVGADGASPNGSASGSSYVVFGRAGGFAANLNLSTLNGTSGFRIDGAAAGDKSGRSVSSAGDVNGDGFDDLIIGAYGADPNGSVSGSSYVVFGKASGFAASLNLSSLDGTNGFRLDGVAAFDFSGGSVSSAGDVNGDGFADLIVGARDADPNGSYSGSSYVIFGQRAQISVNITGTTKGLTHNGGIGDDFIDARDGNDTLRGWEGDDTLLGGTNEDTIDGGAGDDAIAGGSGNDTLDGGADNDTVRGGSGGDTVVGSLGEDFVNGGSGADTLDFSSFAANRPVNVNLATRFVVLHDGDEQTLRSIENVTGSQGNDTLTGNGKANVLNGGSGNDVIDGGAGNDTAAGGAGNDTLIAGTGADVFNGGADVDTVTYAASASAVIAALNGSFTNAGDALGDSFVAIENITGSAFNDTLRGTNGANIIIAGAGNDRIEGLAGIDTLTGGAGNDTFFFNQSSDGADIITDFGSTPTTNDDRFEIRGANFGGLPLGALAANQFQSSTFDTAQTATVRFFHETDTGRLFWDRDGSAGAFGPVLLATLQAGAVVTVGDFTIV